jgi:hypothetical protein
VLRIWQSYIYAMSDQSERPPGLVAEVVPGNEFTDRLVH